MARDIIVGERWVMPRLPYHDVASKEPVALAFYLRDLGYNALPSIEGKYVKTNAPASAVSKAKKLLKPFGKKYRKRSRKY